MENIYQEIISIYNEGVSLITKEMLKNDVEPDFMPIDSKKIDNDLLGPNVLAVKDENSIFPLITFVNVPMVRDGCRAFAYDSYHDKHYLEDSIKGLIYFSDDHSKFEALKCAKDLNAFLNFTKLIYEFELLLYKDKAKYNSKDSREELIGKCVEVLGGSEFEEFASEVIALE